MINLTEKDVQSKTVRRGTVDGMVYCVVRGSCYLYSDIFFGTTTDNGTIFISEHIVDTRIRQAIAILEFWRSISPTKRYADVVQTAIAHTTPDIRPQYVDTLRTFFQHLSIVADHLPDKTLREDVDRTLEALHLYELTRMSA